MRRMREEQVVQRTDQVASGSRDYGGIRCGRGKLDLCLTGLDVSGRQADRRWRNRAQVPETGQWMDSQADSDRYTW